MPSRCRISFFGSRTSPKAQQSADYRLYGIDFAPPAMVTTRGNGFVAAACFFSRQRVAGFSLAILPTNGTSTCNRALRHRACWRQVLKDAFHTNSSVDSVCRSSDLSAELGEGVVRANIRDFIALSSSSRRPGRPLRNQQLVHATKSVKNFQPCAPASGAAPPRPSPAG
jgi:hypothetical protein